MKRLFSALLCALCLFALSACGQASPAASVSAADSAGSPGAGTSSSAAEKPVLTDQARAAALTASLTREEKVGQLFFVRCPEDGALADITAYHLGGYLLFGRDFKEQTANEIIQTLNAYQEAAGADTGIPLLLGTDEEGGTVVRLSSNPKLCKSKFRSPQQLFADGGMEEIVSDTHEKDVLLKALGINVNFAPVCDVSTDPANFIYARSFGQDAAGTSSYVSCVTDTMVKDGMGSVLKHFPGYGNNADTHTGIAVDDRPLETFTSSDLLPFSAGIAAGRTGGAQTAAVLVSHNIVNCMDSQLPASLSPEVHALVRDELGFDGVIMTDDLAMDAVKAYAENGNVALLALRAGNDMVLTTDYRTQIPQVLSALESGALDEATVDAACTRVLLWKISLGLL